MVVLQHQGAATQGVELAGAQDGLAFLGVAVGKIELGGTEDAGLQFANLVDLAFRTDAQQGFNDVARPNLSAGHKIKTRHSGGQWPMVLQLPG